MSDELDSESEASQESEEIENIQEQTSQPDDSNSDGNGAGEVAITPLESPEVAQNHSQLNINNVPEENTATEREYIGKVIDLFLKIKHESPLPPHPQATSPTYSAQFLSFFDNITSTLNPDSVAGRLAVPGDNNEQVNFDMFFKLIHHPLATYNICWAELKGYKTQSSISQLSQKYREFLIKCYKSVNHLHLNHERKYKFYFIVSAPFSPSNWARLKEPVYIREQLTGHIAYEIIEENKISRIANNICILVITWDMLEKVTNYEPS